MVSGNDCKYCNVAETVFQRFQDYFSILRKAYFLYYFRAALKKLAFNSSAIMCYVIKTENVKLKKYPTPEQTVKSHHCSPNEWLGKHTVIMMYYCFYYKFQSNPIEWSVMTSSKLRNEILTVLRICTRKLQSFRSCKWLACLNFLIDLRFFMVFAETRGGVTKL